MYKVNQQNKILGKWHYFFDAWLFATLLDSPVFLKIVGPDDLWIVEPKNSN